MNNWDTELPQNMKHKLNLLLERRNTLKEETKEIQQKELLPKHKNSILKQSNSYQQTVETLLENEKSELIDILDKELTINQSKRYSSQRMPTLEQSTISFHQDQSAMFHKSNKTNRSASTNVSCFQTHSPQLKINETQQTQDYQDQIKEMAKLMKVQQYEQLIKQLQNTIEIQSTQNIENNKQINVLQESNYQLRQKIDLMEKQHQKFQLNTELFKENLIQKLSNYAQKLEKLNENEEQLLKMQKENSRLKQEKEELLLLINCKIRNK